MTWNCQSCTFINNASLDRCEMCNAHRPRHVVTNKVVVDLTTEKEDIKELQRQRQKPTMASMDSARKRKRRLKEQSRNSTTSNISSSISSIHVQKEMSVNDEIQTLSSTNDSHDSTTQTNRRLPLDRTDNSHNASVSNSDCNIQREKKQKKHVVNNNFHDNLPSSPASSSSSSSLPSSSFSSKGNTVANTTKNKIRKSTVQSTLFGSIVTKIKETNPEKLSSKPMKKKSSNIIQIDDEEDDNEENYDNHATNKSMFDISRKSSSSSSSITNFTSSSSSSQLHIPYEQLYQKAIHAMQNIFQIHSLRNLQPKAIESVLQSKSQIIIMATGGGKSLCYQLPAVVLSGVTIVVSPLIALMIDQVHALREKGIEAVNISSANGMKENTIIMQRLLNINNGSDNLKQSQGQGQGRGSQQTNKKRKTVHDSNLKKKQIKLVYCTPELIQTDKFRAVLSDLYKREKLSLIAIDEAHCLSTWGHDFRPAYRKLSWLRTSFPNVPCMACTATATKKVIEDIRNVLSLNNGEDCHMSTFNRPNIHYEVRFKDNMGDAQALEDLTNVVIGEHKKAFEEKVPCSGIVYVHKRDDTKLIAETITEAGISAAPYHAGMKDKERKEMQRQWMNGEVKVAVATVAFGMGIDLAHVRYVLHWAMSKSVEGFYQESGRGGRDGLQSESILYYSKDDASKFQFLIRKTMEAKASKGKSTSGEHRSMETLDKMIKYCTLTSCRRQYLLKHFGENPKLICKKTCDYCINPKKIEAAMDVSMIARARRDVNRQQRQLRHAAKWVGPYGDDIQDSSDEEFYGNTSDSGLGITSYKSNSSNSFSSKPSGFKSAKDVLSQYQAMEKSKGQKNGFVTFKKSLTLKSTDDDNEMLSSKNTSINVPNHLRKKMRLSQNTDSKANESTNLGSKEYRSAADKLRAELAELQRQKEKFASK